MPCVKTHSLVNKSLQTVPFKKEALRFYICLLNKKCLNPKLFYCTFIISEVFVLLFAVLGWSQNPLLPFLEVWDTSRIWKLYGRLGKRLLNLTCPNWKEFSNSTKSTNLNPAPWLWSKEMASWTAWQGQTLGTHNQHRHLLICKHGQKAVMP